MTENENNLPPILILREYLGGQEWINLDTPEGRENWACHVVQDDTEAEELAARIERDGQVVINEQDPLYIERYTLSTEV